MHWHIGTSLQGTPKIVGLKTLLETHYEGAAVANGYRHFNRGRPQFTLSDVLMCSNVHAASSVCPKKNGRGLNHKLGFWLVQHKEVTRIHSKSIQRQYVSYDDDFCNLLVFLHIFSAQLTLGQIVANQTCRPSALISLRRACVGVANSRPTAACPCHQGLDCHHDKCMYTSQSDCTGVLVPTLLVTTHIQPDCPADHVCITLVAIQRNNV